MTEWKVLTLIILLVSGCSKGGSNSPTPAPIPDDLSKAEETLEKNFSKTVPTKACRYQFFSTREDVVDDFGETKKTIIELSLLRFGDGDDFRVSSTLTFKKGDTIELEEKEYYIAVINPAGSTAETSYVLNFKEIGVYHGYNNQVHPYKGSSFEYGELKIEFHNDMETFVKENFGFEKVVELELYPYGCNNE